MAARIEDGVVVFLSHAVEAQRLVELSFGSGVLLEPTRDVGLKAGVLALGIERRASALGIPVTESAAKPALPASTIHVIAAFWRSLRVRASAPEKFQ
jgi:hypothetical protein